MLFREINLPAKAMVPDYTEIASTWANVGVGTEARDESPPWLSVCYWTQDPKLSLSFGLSNVFYSNSFVKQIHLDKHGFLNLIWECKKCLTWQNKWMLM